jgi:hypothetical protein
MMEQSAAAQQIAPSVPVGPPVYVENQVKGTLRPVPEQLSRAGQAVDGLDSALGELTDRLFPVLQPVEPSADRVPEASLSPNLGVSDLTAQLRALNIQFEAHAARIYEIIARLDI